MGLGLGLGLPGIMQVGGGLISSGADWLRTVSEMKQKGFDTDKINAFLGTMTGADYSQPGAPSILGPNGEVGGAWGALRNRTGKEYSDVARLATGKLGSDTRGLNTLFDQQDVANKWLGVNAGNNLAKFGSEAGAALDARSQGMGSALAGAKGETLSLLQGRLDKAMGMIENAGAGERADIGRQYGAQAGSIDARNRQAGLAGTTIASGSQLANERAKSYDMGGLNDRLINQRVGTYSALSGDIANATSQFGMAGLGIADQLSAERANLATGMAGSRQSLADLVAQTNTQLPIDRLAAQTQLGSDFQSQMIGLRQGYGEGGLSGSLDRDMLSATMSGMLGSDIRFPGFTGLDALGGTWTTIGNNLAMQREANKPQKKSGLFGLGGAAGGTAGAIGGAFLGAALTPYTGGASMFMGGLAPTVFGGLAGGGLGYAMDR